jgi:hypothetical protein
LKFKRSHIFLLLLLVIYTLSVAGVTINKHFCGGELEEVSLLEPDSCCGEEMPVEDDGCCSNESVYVSNDTETINSGEKILISCKALYLQTLLNFFQISFDGLAVRLKIEKDVSEKPPFLEEELVAKTMVIRI